jgi:anti-anti-sigma factor
MGLATGFTVQSESRNGVGKIAMAGELDIAGVWIMQGHLAKLEQSGVTAIILDVREVSFVDSAGLHAFLQASDRAKTNGHRFVLIGPQPSAQRVFMLTGTEFLLDQREAASIVGQFTGRGRPIDPAEFVSTDGDV